MERGVRKRRNFILGPITQVFNHMTCTPLFLLCLHHGILLGVLVAAQLFVLEVFGLYFPCLKSSRIQVQGSRGMSWVLPAALSDLSSPANLKGTWALISHENASPLTHFEVCCFQGGAGEEPGEHHVDGDGEAPAHVPVGDLDVLDLRGVPGVAFSTPWAWQEGHGERREMGGGERKQQPRFPMEIHQDSGGEVPCKFSRS